MTNQAIVQFMGDISLIISYFGAAIGIFMACALGVPVPEEITMLWAGILVSARDIPLGHAVFSSWAGLLASDSTLYLLGRYFGRQVFRLPLLRTVLTESRVKWAESHIRGDGPLVCFIGRFLPGLRIVIFTTSGALGLKPHVFIAIDTLAAVITVSLWISLGNWMGSNIINASRYGGEIGLISISIALLIVVINIIWKLIFRKIQIRR